MSACQHVGCLETATRVPMIEMRLHQVFANDKPWELVLSLEMCEAHARAVEGADSALIRDEKPAEFLRKLNLAHMRAGGPAYDLARTTVVTIPIADERYQILLRAQRKAANPEGVIP